jgi:hypothetical protein
MFGGMKSGMADEPPITTIMRKGRRYEQEQIITRIAYALDFAHDRDSIKSVIESGIRQHTLGHKGGEIWRKA